MGGWLPIATKKYNLDDSLGYKLFHASRQICGRLNQNFRNNDYPVTYEQWQILSRLYERDGQTQNQIAQQNERDQASVSRLIDNMIKRDLVKRVAHETDKRINIVLLTEKSKIIQEELEKLAFKTIGQAANEIDDRELEVCLKVLDQIRKNLNTSSI